MQSIGVTPEARAFLVELGARDIVHRGARSLLDHLVGTEAILSAWSQPRDICLGGLFHSVYGNDVFRRQLVEPGRRSEMRARIGVVAERLAYLFHVLSRPSLFAELGSAGRIPSRSVVLDGETVTPDEMAALLVIHMANLAEQSYAADRGPSEWVGRTLRWGSLLRRDRDAVPEVVLLAPPPPPHEEQEALAAYREGLARVAVAPKDAATLFARVRAVCAAVAEPGVWLALLALHFGDVRTAKRHAADAEARLRAWGVAWDKRIPLEEWLRLTAMLRGGSPLRALSDSLDPTNSVADAIRALLRARAPATRPDRARGHGQAPAVDESRGLTPRLSTYLRAIATQGSAGRKVFYPGLSAKPWHEPSAFPIVGALESSFPTIRDEVISLSPATFHSESEPIGRRGSWEVAFLYESGRRDAVICEACPTLARIVDEFSTIRTMGGLIYLSRLRPGTRIRPHHGPTNLRLRCHLGVRVPPHSCGITVDAETRTWEEGKCLVFDDTFLHSAWNTSDEDRIVVVVDLWHPDLSADEVAVLSGLHRYIAQQGERLTRYHAANAEARHRALGKAL
jgi:hypothetical protein